MRRGDWNRDWGIEGLVGLQLVLIVVVMIMGWLVVVEAGEGMWRVWSRWMLCLRWSVRAQLVLELGTQTAATA